MPFKKLNIEIGAKYNKLTVISFDGKNENGHFMYKCSCDCGNYIITRGSALISGNTKGCGCLNGVWNENHYKSIITHGATVGGKRTPEYQAYVRMIQRCYNPNVERYPNYGGRGITVCDRWLKSFENFLEDMGERPSPSHSLDRYPDVNGNYEPSNCRWGTQRQQSSNKTTTIRLTANGKETYQAELANLLGVNPHSIQYHLKKGKSGDDIFNYFKIKNKLYDVTI